MYAYVRAGFLAATIATTLGWLFLYVERTSISQRRGELPTMQFDTLREQYQDMTFEEFGSHLEPPRFLERLPFEPSQSRYFDLVQYRLELTTTEREIFSTNGFVTIDQGRELSFPRAYEQVYVSDLPYSH